MKDNKCEIVLDLFPQSNFLQPGIFKAFWGLSIAVVFK